ncbi:MAG TPA: peptidyl-prolyl cis-trans isomerase [Candidatus Eisenbacteria bacterium]
MNRDLTRTTPIRAISALLLSTIILCALAAAAEAKTPPALRGPVATVGGRSVEAIDIQRAAMSLGVEPPRGVTARAWRRTLLDRCVDRELLALEAERRGLLDDPALRRELTEREYAILMKLLYEKVLVPGIIPTPAELDSIKKAGRYRWLDLDYILVRDDVDKGRLGVAVRIIDRARRGASWDSLAKIYSGHPPSAAAGGHFGPVLVKDVEPAAQDSIAFAKPGEIFGPYSGPYGHEIYKVRGWIEVGDDSLMRLLVDERTRLIHQRHSDAVLRKYHFAADSANVKQAMATFRSESSDSIMASLGPDGTRAAIGIRPAVGIIARADGAKVTIADVIRYARPGANEHGRVRVHDFNEMTTFAARTIVHELIVRDARERGLDKDPLVARQLRLCRDELATKAMVARARPADPSASALDAYIEKNASRYRSPASRQARVAMFSNADSAREALKAWNGIGFPPDSTFQAMGFKIRKNVRPGTLWPKQVSTLSIPEASNEPLNLSLRALAAGQFAPATEMLNGWAVAMMTGREEAAPLSPEEAAPRALRDWREEMENQWVTDQLERLRAKTPVNVVPARLEAVRLAPAAPSAPAAKKRAAR